MAAEGSRTSIVGSQLLLPIHAHSLGHSLSPPFIFIPFVTLTRTLASHFNGMKAILSISSSLSCQWIHRCFSMSKQCITMSNVADTLNITIFLTIDMIKTTSVEWRLFSDSPHLFCLDEHTTTFQWVNNASQRAIWQTVQWIKLCFNYHTNILKPSSPKTMTVVASLFIVSSSPFQDENSNACLSFLLLVSSIELERRSLSCLWALNLCPWHTL